MQLCSMIFEYIYKYIGKYLTRKMILISPSYPNISPLLPQQSPWSFSHIFLPNFCYTESKLFYIKYRLLRSQTCLCCNFFYGHPEFPTFLLNYYKKSSIDNTLHLKFKKKTEISMYTACVFRLSFRSL